MSGLNLDWLGGADQPTSEEDLAEQKRQMEAMAQAERELNALVLSVFGTGRGPELLEWLRDNTVECSPLKINNGAGQIAGNEFPIQPSDWLMIRAGQNSIVHELERRIAIARKPEPAPETPKGETN
jgi:hypothetical protein